jgi:hypothetical protein
MAAAKRIHVQQINRAQQSDAFALRVALSDLLNLTADQRQVALADFVEIDPALARCLGLEINYSLL